jgi:membrane-bound lytic murein transglycosylase B
MVGSWAGAMGQVQFMPSSFLQFAVDFDDDGRKDLWTTPADIFASAANYLARSGWRYDKTWGRRVRLPEGFDRSLMGLEVERTLDDWQKLGVRRVNGDDLPRVEITASLITPSDEGGPPFLVYSNYRTILKWNRSHFFALAVGRLADLLADR